MREQYTTKIEDLMKSMDDIFEKAEQDVIQENANTDGRSAVGQLSLVAGEGAKMYAENLLSDRVLEAFKEGYIHIHDFDWYATGSTTCCQIPLDKVLKGGFRVGECDIREPQSIGTAVALAAIILQSNQNTQHR